MHAESSKGSNGREAVDTFIVALPWDDKRKVLVYHRIYRGREYVRIRTWNFHADYETWYPTPASFIVPLANADDLADALHAAARAEPMEPEPEWLGEFQDQYERYLAENPGRPKRKRRSRRRAIQDTSDALVGPV